MSKKTKQRPVETLRDSAIKAAIWRNESENGAFHSVTFGRTYTDNDGKAQSAESFSGSQILRLAHLAQKAYDRARELDRAEKADTETDEGEGA